MQPFDLRKMHIKHDFGPIKYERRLMISGLDQLLLFRLIGLAMAMPGGSFLLLIFKIANLLFDSVRLFYSYFVKCNNSISWIIIQLLKISVSTLDTSIICLRDYHFTVW